MMDDFVQRLVHTYNGARPKMEKISAGHRIQRLERKASMMRANVARPPAPQSYDI